LLCWPGCNFLWLGVAHFTGNHRAFGKRRDGTLPWWSKLLHFPLLSFTTVVWHVERLLKREPACNRVDEHLVVCRRLLSHEVSGECVNFVDLTAEFEEPHAIRQRAGYISYPILNGDAPTPESLLALVSRLEPGQTCVHCAAGHGRTALFALALLFWWGTVTDIETGLQVLRAARPGIHLSRQQLLCIESYAKLVLAARASRQSGGGSSTISQPDQ